MSAQCLVREIESIHQAHDVPPEDLHLAGKGLKELLPESDQVIPIRTEKYDASQSKNDLQQRRLRVEAAAAAIRASISKPMRCVAKCQPILVTRLDSGKVVLSLAIPVSKPPDVVTACSPMATTSLVASEAQTNTIAINLSTCDPIAQHLPEVNAKLFGATPPITQKRKSSIAPLNCEQIARSLKAGKKVKDCFVEYLAGNDGQRVFGRAMFYALTKKSKHESAHIHTLIRSSAPSPSS